MNILLLLIHTLYLFPCLKYYLLCLYLRIVYLFLKAQLKFMQIFFMCRRLQLIRFSYLTKPQYLFFKRGKHSTRNSRLIYNFLSYHRFSSPYNTFVSTLSSVSISKSTREALSHSKRRQSMVNEKTAVHTNDDI